MKVSELIEKLKHCNPEAEVIYWNEFGWMKATTLTAMRVEPVLRGRDHCGDFIDTKTGTGLPAVAIESLGE